MPSNASMEKNPASGPGRKNEKRHGFGGLAHEKLRPVVALFRRLGEPVKGTAVILLHRNPVVVKESQITRGPDVSRLGGLAVKLRGLFLVLLVSPGAAAFRRVL